MCYINGGPNNGLCLPKCTTGSCLEWETCNLGTDVDAATYLCDPNECTVAADCGSMVCESGYCTSCTEGWTGDVVARCPDNIDYETQYVCDVSTGKCEEETPLDGSILVLIFTLAVIAVGGSLIGLIYCKKKNTTAHRSDILD